jgi:hypothetical protein
MSLLGFDAVGRLALAQIQRGNISMPAVSGSFTIAGAAQTFKTTENTAAGAFAMSGVALTEIIGVVSGSFVLTGAAQTFKITEHVTAGSYVITGAIANNLSGAADPGAFNLSGVNTALRWTGAGVDTSYTGGVGHYLEEIQRQKQLNAITRKIPGPVDRRTIPRFAPLQAPPSAPPAPAPDMAAVQNQRTPEAAAQAEAAKKRRREEEAVLLLAS